MNPRTGKLERVFVNLAAVYPNADDPNEELSFEELRARSRGWLDKDWTADRQKSNQSQMTSQPAVQSISSPPTVDDVVAGDTQESQQTFSVIEQDDSKHELTSVKEVPREGKAGRPKKMKVMEVKGETQTSKQGYPIGHGYTDAIQSKQILNRRLDQSFDVRLLPSQL